MQRVMHWAALSALVWVLAAARGSEAGQDEIWRRVTSLPAAPVTALVESRDGARLAAAAAGGVYLSTDGGRRWRRMARPGGEVVALAFVRDGAHGPAIIAAADDGVHWSVDFKSWRPLDLPGLGRRGAVHALTADPTGSGRLAFGTDDGVVIARSTGGAFRESASALPGREVGGIAWLDQGTLVAATAEGVFRLDAARGASASRIDSRPAIAVASSGGWAMALTEGGLLGASPDGKWSAVAAGGGFASRPTCVSALGPGEVGFAVADAFKLWRYHPGRPPVVIAPAPPGETATMILEREDGKILGATDRGLFTLAVAERAWADRRRERFAPLPPGPVRFGLDRAAGVPEPDIASVRRAALRAASLEPERIRRNFRGARLRALLPDLEISLRRRSIFNRQQDHDQAFSSGAIRRLFDSSLDRDNERDFVIAAEWDLGSLLFNPDELDVSEEARRVLTLRDDVLDEVNQIYFERRRALAALLRIEEARGAAGGGAPAEAEIQELRIRVEELTARLDAWTEGFFSREKARLAGGRENAPL